MLDAECDLPIPETDAPVLGRQQNTKDFLEGLRDLAPMLLGFIPFAVISGSTAASAGLTLPECLSMSVFIFAGVSQLALVEMMEKNTPAAICLLVAVIINLRLMMYSAGMAPKLKPERPAVKALGAYLLTDHAYLMATMRHTRRPVWWYYLGVAGSIWVIWQGGTLAGVLLGRGLPPEWSLDFAIPVSFTALLVPAVKNRSHLASALTAGLVMFFAAGLPFNLGLVAAAVSGVVAGMMVKGAAT